MKKKQQTGRCGLFKHEDTHRWSCVSVNLHCLWKLGRCKPGCAYFALILHLSMNWGQGRKWKYKLVYFSVISFATAHNTGHSDDSCSQRYRITQFRVQRREARLMRHSWFLEKRKKIHGQQEQLYTFWCIEAPVCPKSKSESQESKVSSAAGD